MWKWKLQDNLTNRNWSTEPWKLNLTRTKVKSCMVNHRCARKIWLQSLSGQQLVCVPIDWDSSEGKSPKSHPQEITWSAFLRINVSKGLWEDRIVSVLEYSVRGATFKEELDELSSWRKSPNQVTWEAVLAANPAGPENQVSQHLWVAQYASLCWPPEIMSTENKGPAPLPSLSWHFRVGNNKCPIKGQI